MSVSSPSKAVDPALTVADLLRCSVEEVLANTGNPYLDQLIRVHDSKISGISRSMDIHTHKPSLAGDILALPARERGDIFVRLAVCVLKCGPKLYMSNYGWQEKYAHDSKRLCAMAKKIAAQHTMQIDSADAALVLKFICDPDGSYARDRHHHGVYETYGLHPDWEAESFVWWPRAILGAVQRNAEQQYASEFHDLLSRIAAKWDRFPEESCPESGETVRWKKRRLRRVGHGPGDEIVSLRKRIAKLRGEAESQIFNGIFADPVVMKAQEELNDLVMQSPILLELFPHRKAKLKMITDEGMPDASTKERGEVFAFAVKMNTILEDNGYKRYCASVQRSTCPAIVREFEFANLAYGKALWMARKPMAFTAEQAVWVIEAKWGLQDTGVYRSVARAVTPDTPGAVEAYAALLAEPKYSGSRSKESIKSLKYLKDVLGAVEDDNLEATLSKSIRESVTALARFVPEEGTDNTRWSDAARAAIDPKPFERYAVAARKLVTRDSWPIPADQEPLWVYRDALNRHAQSLVGRIVADVLALSRYGHDSPDVFDALRRHDGVCDEFCGLYQYGYQYRARYATHSLATECRQRIGFYLAATPAVREVFAAMEAFCAEAPTGSRPSAAFLRKADAALTGAQWTTILDHLPAFLASTDPGLPHNVTDYHAAADAPLIALIWLLAGQPVDRVLPLVGAYALRCFASQPGRGIKAEKLGNACLWTLQQYSDGAGAPYLARIAARVKYPKVKKKIDAALNAAAEAAGMTRIDLDELLVPDHGFTHGERRFNTDHGSAILGLTPDGRVTLAWVNADGKPVKTPTAAMKTHEAEIIKAAKALQKEAQADLKVQLARIERLPLEDRAIPADDFVARYLDQPLIGPACRALIWQIGERHGSWQDGALHDLDGEAIPLEGMVRLWHPVEHSSDTVIAWRDRLEELDLMQPIRQAWREVYVVTDAERATGTYSNRFAGHILKQHQMMSLARTNGWHCTHRIQQDVSNDDPTWIAFPAHGVQAEYWTGVLDVAAPTLDSSAFVHIRSDRTAFYHHDGQKRGKPMKVDDLPQIVFSEVMRQCDLFVSVASVATDPEWHDRGINAAHPSGWERDIDTYWHAASDADLSGSAVVRREALERIVPRLKIADRLTLGVRHLCVNGVKRSYRIHLGSAAVHREPDNQHVCIVPKGAVLRASNNVRLPFEGDRMLSLILSKAIMLAADDRIKDEVILSQI